MAIKPILFNTEMVRAIREGRKTETRRRIIPRYRDSECGFQIVQRAFTGEFVRVEILDENEYCTRYLQPKYSPGDILWVRETWCQIPVSPGGHTRIPGIYYYAADGDLRPEGWQGNWKPSIHMPKEAAREFLRVTGVRAEPLRNISADSCAAEGVLPLYSGPARDRNDYYKVEFAKLWNSTIAKDKLPSYGWQGNPWVWVYQFERCDRPKEF